MAPRGLIVGPTESHVGRGVGGKVVGRGKKEAGEEWAGRWGSPGVAAGGAGSTGVRGSNCDGGPTPQEGVDPAGPGTIGRGLDKRRHRHVVYGAL